MIICAGVNINLADTVGYISMAEKDYLLGYLAHYLSPQGAYYGGLLVTDTLGVPREFRHTEAVKPNRTQIILYGDSLENSLGTDALGPALYNALTLKPEMLLIDRESRTLFGSFVLRYPPAALLVALADRDLAFNDMIAFEGNLLVASEYALKGARDERVYAYIEDRGADGASILEIAQKRMNLISPFARIRTVLAEVAQIDQGRGR